MFKDIWLDSIDNINYIQGDIMNYINKNLKRIKGFALPVVLMVMVVLSILFISIITIAQANTKQVAIQEDNLRAYYLARSGIDIAYAALMEEKDGELKINKFLKDSKETLTHENLPLPNNTDPVGYVDIEVSKIGDEVKIHAVARMAKGSGTSSLSFYIDKNNFTKNRWVKE